MTTTTKSGGTVPTVRCSFCGKTAGEVAKVVAGPGVCICDECIELCNQIVAETDAPAAFAALEGKGTEELLAAMVRIASSREQVEQNVGVVVRELRARGVTWARIGEALGMTRQSAWERYSGEE